MELSFLSYKAICVVIKFSKFIYFLDISFAGIDPKRTCGDFSTIENENSDFGPNKLNVIFQTNRNRQNNGFFMVVSCVSPDFGGHEGCTQDQVDGGRRRRKRGRKAEMVTQSDNLIFIL